MRTEGARAHLLTAPAPVALRRAGRSAGKGGHAKAAGDPGPARRPRAAAPGRAVVTEDVALRTLLPHGGRRGLAHAAGGLQAQRHGGRLGRPPRAERHGNGGRLHRPPRGRPATPASGRAGEARSAVLCRLHRCPAAATAPRKGEAGWGSPGPSPGAGPPAGDAGPILGLTSWESQLWSEGGPRGGRGSRHSKARRFRRRTELPATSWAPGRGGARQVGVADLSLQAKSSITRITITCHSLF